MAKMLVEMADGTNHQFLLEMDYVQAVEPHKDGETVYMVLVRSGNHGFGQYHVKGSLEYWTRKLTSGDTTMTVGNHQVTFCTAG